MSSESLRTGAVTFLQKRVVIGSLACLALASCGGGNDNHPPTAAAQAVSGAEDTLITGTVQASDTDNDPLTYAIATPAPHGQAAIQPGGGFQYQPAPNFNGSDIFVVRVSDPSGATAQATITITVTPVNDPPSVTSTSLAVNQGTNLSMTLTATDPEGDAITFTQLSNPTHGKMVAFDSSGSLTYSPDTGYFGSDSFSLSMTDSLGASATAQVSIKVNAPPTAHDDIISVGTGSPATVDVLANDTDPDSDPLSIEITAVPTVGAASVTSDRKVALDLPSGFRGFTRFGYRVHDTGGLVSAATAVVFVDTMPIRVTWMGDEFTPGSNEIAINNLITSQMVNAPLATGEAIANVVFRPDSVQPLVGYNSSFGYAYWTALNAPGHAQRIGPASATVTDISADGLSALYSSGIDTVWLASLMDPAAVLQLNPTSVCAGALGPLSTDVFLECTQPGPTFLSPTFYHSQISSPTVFAQLSPALSAPTPPGQFTITPDGGAVIYITTRTDSGGTYRAIFMAKVSSPGQEIRVSQRFSYLGNDGIGGGLQFSPDGKKLLYSAYVITDPGFCNLWLADLAGSAAPVMVNAPHDSTSCPIQAQFSPDSQRLIYSAPPPGNSLQLGVYEVTLNNPGSAATLLAPTSPGYGQVTYDEAGTNLFFVTTPQAPGLPVSGLFEWHRGSSSPAVQLSSSSTSVRTYVRSDDGAMIVYTSMRTNATADVYILNRSVPGQAIVLSNSASQIGMNQLQGMYIVSQ